VQAINAGRALSQTLNIKTGSPVLQVQTIAYDQSGIPVELGRSFYRGDRFEYRVQLKNE
jgi:GntR family transcriptional regulator